MMPILRRAGSRNKEKRRRELTIQFKEMTSSLLTALKAGYAAENAVKEAYEDMCFLYGKNSLISMELKTLLLGLDNNIPLERLLKEFGARSEVAEIQEFADVFAIAKRSGGSMTDILSRTIQLIQNRIDIENEITILISAKKLEQNIMDVVPFFIILYIRLTSKGFFNVLYHNPAGILFMSLCLCVYGGAFLLSEKITAISI